MKLTLQAEFDDEIGSFDLYWWQDWLLKLRFKTRLTLYAEIDDEIGS